MKTLLTVFLILVSATGANAAYQISCPSKNIIALNQTNQYITTETINGVTSNKTVVYDVPYFNKLFNATDCTIKQIANPAPAQISAQNALLDSQRAHAQQAASIEAQIKANREAYIDALIAGDTVKQNSIAKVHASLIAQKDAINKERK